MSQQIYFHVGLSKTGTTFLQEKVFPKLKGIHYLPTIKYRHALKIIPKLMHDKILVSREFDQQFEQEIKKFSTQYSNAKPIIVLREPASWIISNYKRFVKNGHNISLIEFFDVEKDKGLFKKQDLDYLRYISLLEEHFTQKPLVLFYEDLRLNSKDFVQKILDYTDAQLNFNEVDWKPKHVSYNENALKLVKKFSSKIQFQKKLEVHVKPKGFLYNLYANTVRYSILYGSKILAESYFPQEDLYNVDQAKAIQKHYEKDWEKLKEKYA